ncbi:MAG: DUF1993 domain-containing protein [Proteobacteria bacterium]|nr:DUF1993 domain-containing protein [Pseudomonadota bacterium]
MFKETITQFNRVLGNLDLILQKAQAFADTKKFDSGNFASQRISPDMFPMNRQIQIACDVAKASAAAISGVEAPKHADTEKTIPELRERIAKVRTFLGSIPENKYHDVDPNRKISIPFPSGKFMILHEAIVTRSIPNFYFHVSMTYAILRQGGVEIGKNDYLGSLNILD